MRWVLSTMKLKPYSCAACGSTPQKEDGTGAEPAAFREGVDINWGDSLYICCSCARVVGGLFGMLDPDEVKALRKENKELGEQLDELREEHETQEALIERIREGTKAQKEIRQRPKKKVSA
jgi:hypothetical protein